MAARSQRRPCSAPMNPASLTFSGRERVPLFPGAESEFFFCLPKGFEADRGIAQGGSASYFGAL